MVTPMQSRETVPDELQNYKELLSEIDSEVFLAGVKRGKIRLQTGDKTTSRAGRRMTMRITPDLQKKWVRAINELSTASPESLPEVKKRASVQFAAAFKGGGFVIEVKENGKRTAYTSEETAKDIQNGAIVLMKNGDKSVTYDSINVIHSEDFLSGLASSFITIMLNENEPAATLSSDSIKETKDASHDGSSIHTDITNTVKMADPDKKVSIKKPDTVKPEKTETQKNNELLKNEEAAHTQEHDIQHAKLTEKREEDREKDKLESSELKREEIQTIDNRNTVEKEQSEVVETIKAEQTSPSDPNETVT